MNEHRSNPEETLQQLLKELTEEIASKWSGKTHQKSEDLPGTWAELVGCLKKAGKNLQSHDLLRKFGFEIKEGRIQSVSDTPQKFQKEMRLFYFDKVALYCWLQKYRFLAQRAEKEISEDDPKFRESPDQIPESRLWEKIADRLLTTGATIRRYVSESDQTQHRLKFFLGGLLISADHLDFPEILEAQLFARRRVMQLLALLLNPESPPLEISRDEVAFLAYCLEQFPTFVDADLHEKQLMVDKIRLTAFAEGVIVSSVTVEHLFGVLQDHARLFFDTEFLEFEFCRSITGELFQ